MLNYGDVKMGLFGLSGKESKDLSDIADNARDDATKKKYYDTERLPSIKIMNWYSACYKELKPIPKEITYERIDRYKLAKFIIGELISIAEDGHADTGAYLIPILINGGIKIGGLPMDKKITDAFLEHDSSIGTGGMFFRRLQEALNHIRGAVTFEDQYGLFGAYQEDILGIT